MNTTALTTVGQTDPRSAHHNAAADMSMSAEKTWKAMAPPPCTGTMPSWRLMICPAVAPWKRISSALRTAVICRAVRALLPVRVRAIPPMFDMIGFSSRPEPRPRGRQRRTDLRSFSAESSTLATGRLHTSGGTRLQDGRRRVTVDRGPHQPGVGDRAVVRENPVPPARTTRGVAAARAKVAGRGERRIVQLLGVADPVAVAVGA